MESSMVAPTFSSTQLPAKAQPKHFYFLDGLRGLASLWVLFFHIGTESVPLLSSYIPSPLKTLIFDMGSLGVAVFFVLSGFVISYSLRNIVLSQSYLKNFTLRRWVRLSPPYYASIIAVIALNMLAAAAKGDSVALPSAASFLSHLLYLQDVLGIGHISDVYWTICLEIQFYLIFCCLLWGAQCYAKRNQAPGTELFCCHVSQVVFAIGGLIAAIYPLFIEASSRPVWFGHQIYGFFLGVFAYWCWTRRLSSLLFYGYSLLIWTGSVINQDHFAMTAVLTAIGLLQIAQLQRLGRWLAGPIAQFFGQISYSLYLIHVPIVGASLFLGQQLWGTGSLWAESASLGTAIALSILAATISWQFIERPSMKWSKRLKPQPAAAYPKPQ